MNGKELRAIRMFNKISQIEFAKEIGYNTADTLRKVEDSMFIPKIYIDTISRLIGINFHDKHKLYLYLINLPNEVHCRYRKTANYYNKQKIKSLKKTDDLSQIDINYIKYFINK